MLATRRKWVLVLVLALLLVVLFTAPFIQMAFSVPLFAHGKGGVGIISHDIFVVTKSKRNSVLWDHDGSRHTWTGRSAEHTETVVLDSSGVVPFSPRSLGLHSVVIHFTPSRIYYYDISELSGGHYLRWLEDQT
jgi:hypothetical protein